MPVLILIAMGAVFLVWRLWARDRVESALGRKLDPLAARLFRRSKFCWVTTGTNEGTLQEFQCATCGVTAYSQSSSGPRECKRRLMGGL
jgi:hypothetical protein